MLLFCLLRPGKTNKQCGGARGMYNGPTTCCSAHDTCVQHNYYYSQCLPPAEAAHADVASAAELAHSTAANAADKALAAKTVKVHGEKDSAAA